ncbi:MAG: SIMPL domain-containing protein [Candidatus Limnocylindrales bacterium]
MNEKPSNAKLETAPATPEPTRPARLTLGRIVAVTAAASLLVGILVGPIIANHPASAADASATPEHTVAVSGAGTVSVTPDVADVTFGVSATKPTAKDARAAAASAMTAVLTAVKSDGVSDKDITTVNLSLNPVYDYSSSAPRLTGYQFSNTITVTVRDLGKVAAVVDDSVAAGATTVQGISFRLDDPTTVEAQARQLAMADAHAKANALAQAAGVSIKGVATISEVSASSPITYYPTAGLAAGSASVSTPIQTGTTDITVQVTVSYLIG